MLSFPNVLVLVLAEAPWAAHFVDCGLFAIVLALISGELRVLELITRRHRRGGGYKCEGTDNKIGMP